MSDRTAAAAVGEAGADEELLTAEQVAPLFQRQPRTILQWMDEKKLGCVRVGRRVWTTRTMVEAYQRVLYLQKHPLAVLEVSGDGLPGARTLGISFGAGAPAAPTTASARQAIAEGRSPTAEAMAAALLGDAAAPEAIAHFGARIRRNWQALTEVLPTPLARDIFLRFCDSVERAVARQHHLQQLAPGVTAACAVLVAVGAAAVT